MAFSSTKPVAVFVDAQIVSAGEARSAIAVLAERFAPLILHAFGDFRHDTRQDWTDLLAEFGGQAMQVTPITELGHSVDICMTMNIMEVVGRRQASAVCVFCGRGDYSQLAVKVRQAGLPVLGFGSVEAGRVLAGYFDDWYALDGDSEEPATADRPAVGADTDDHDQLAQLLAEGSEAGYERSSQRSPVTKSAADGCDASSDPLPEVVEDAGNDDDAMAAIEGRPGFERQKLKDSAPPIFEDIGDFKLGDDITLLLSGLIETNLRQNGYALLDEVAAAAESADSIVPPERKSSPVTYLKQLVGDDSRFEIATLEYGAEKREFIRRI